MSISKRAAVSASALSLVVGLGVGFGVASCAGPDVPPVSTTASPSAPAPSLSGDQDGRRTASEAKKKLDAFLGDVRKEASDFGNTGSFEEKYKASYSHIGKKVPAEDGRAIIETFSVLYQMDPNAEVATKEEDFVLDGDNARISGTSFVLTVNGNVVDSSDSEGAGTLILGFNDDQWSLNKMEF